MSKGFQKMYFYPHTNKEDTKDCSNYRIIALISHASKTLLEIIQQVLNHRQGDFRKGRGTFDHIANLHWMMETAREYQKDLYMCLIDYSKAFDCIDHDKLWKCLKEMEISPHLTQLIRSLYSKQKPL
ncbi:uncharacterized protein LOC111636637 [Centruroides sculpturatus]|uniref:uncharacterized protein LOC111636637 n=1 Tax=Centruroides sculpturatus TaxID=218467 RepID=UPI000C6E7F38|nr:uncharacterized protein LOC111636637 [Centruroides sculpturatus]